MINDHLPGTSCSIHGRSRVDEFSERSPDKSCVGDVIDDCTEVASASISSPHDDDAGKQRGRVSVLILMCTYNGQVFLEKQLESINSQTCRDWHVAIFDDGSQDETLNIAKRYRLKWGAQKISLWQGPGQGFAKNFISSVCKKELIADHYAWCDQDDVWHEQKLQAALTWLTSVPENIPALYLGRTQLVDSLGVALGYSPLFQRPPSFANAIVQNIGGGNTMVLNHAARILLEKAGEGLEVVSHDWWAYLLVTGAGGNVFYDPSPYVMYRQHAGNLVGANSNLRAKLIRLKMMFQGRFKLWNSINIENLDKVIGSLSHENREILERFKALRGETFTRRLTGFKQSGIYRQTRLGNLSLIMAVLMGKV